MSNRYWQSTDPALSGVMTQQYDVEPDDETIDKVPEDLFEISLRVEMETYNVFEDFLRSKGLLSDITYTEFARAGYLWPTSNPLWDVRFTVTDEEGQEEAEEWLVELYNCCRLLEPMPFKHIMDGREHEFKIVCFV